MPFNARVAYALQAWRIRSLGDIRIDNHMKVGGSDMESGQSPSFLRAKLHDGVPYSPPVLIPAQLGSGFRSSFCEHDPQDEVRLRDSQCGGRYSRDCHPASKTRKWRMSAGMALFR